jgi:hypothetical protein
MLSVAGLVVNNLLKKSKTGTNCHTGRGEAEIRYPDAFFLLDSGHPPSANSGMTNLATTTDSLVPSAYCLVPSTLRPLSSVLRPLSSIFRSALCAKRLIVLPPPTPGSPPWSARSMR